MKFKMTLAVAALLTIGLSSAATYADTITFTLMNPDRSAKMTGEILTYDATVFAPASNSAAVFLNGDSFNVTAPTILDDSGFLSNFPLSLAPGTSFTGELFMLTVPPGTPVGTFVGTFTLLGGANGNAGDTLGTVNFSATVATPEPSSVVLLLTGMTGLGMPLLWAGFRNNLRIRAHVVARNN